MVISAIEKIQDDKNRNAVPFIKSIYMICFLFLINNPKNVVQHNATSFGYKQHVCFLGLSIAPQKDYGTFQPKNIYLSTIFSCFPIGRCREVVQVLSTLWPAEQFLSGFWPMAASFGNSRKPWSHPSAHHLLQLCQIPGVHGRQDHGSHIVRQNLLWFYVIDTVV